MVFKALDTGPNGLVSIKGVDGQMVSIQLCTERSGKETDDVDKENPGRPFREKGCVRDQSRIEKLPGREGASHNINTAKEGLPEKEDGKMQGTGKADPQ